MAYGDAADAMRYTMIDAMMRAGIAETAMAARDYRPAMDIHKYNTPTANNREVPFSIGIMNMTEAECEAIISFARDVARSRSTRANDYRPASGPPPTNAERLESMMAGLKAGTISKATFLEEIRRTSGVGYDVEKRAALLTQIANDPSDERSKWLTGDWGLGKADEEKAAEPEVKGNRFSGLDIE